MEKTLLNDIWEGEVTRAELSSSQTITGDGTANRIDFDNVDSANGNFDLGGSFTTNPTYFQAGGVFKPILLVSFSGRLNLQSAGEQAWAVVQANDADDVELDFAESQGAAVGLSGSQLTAIEVPGASRDISVAVYQDSGADRTMPAGATVSIYPVTRPDQLI